MQLIYTGGGGSDDDAQAYMTPNTCHGCVFRQCNTSIIWSFASILLYIQSLNRFLLCLFFFCYLLLPFFVVADDAAAAADADAPAETQTANLMVLMMMIVLKKIFC